jgi:hypothetical protein
VALRRESAWRGRRLRLDEALFERFAMSPVGYQFLLRVAPRIDKILIPRTRGRLSSTGFDKVGVVTTTGAKSGQPRTNPLVLIDDGEWPACRRLELWTLEPPSVERQPAGPPRVHGRVPEHAVHGRTPHGRVAPSAWATAIDFYAGYEGYRITCAPREIRVFRLRPAAG